MKMSNEKGFTLIELMVVIVIIGILVAIALPNFMGATDRAKVANTKANMHTGQTMMETYAIDWGGLYPDSTTNLLNEAGSNNYLKTFRNPIGTGNAYETASATITTSANTYTKGAVYYNFDSATRYYIYGADSSGKAIKDKGNLFYLTNN